MRAASNTTESKTYILKSDFKSAVLIIICNQTVFQNPTELTKNAQYLLSHKEVLGLKALIF